jgi:hypothetical protein
MKPKGMLENVVVSINSLEYLIDFMALETKFGLNGYLLILGRPWLTTTDAHINYRSWEMIIAHGQSLKKLTLYPLAKPFLEVEKPLWVGLEEGDALFRVVS